MCLHKYAVCMCVHVCLHTCAQRPRGGLVPQSWGFKFQDAWLVPWVLVSPYPPLSPQSSFRQGLTSYLSLLSAGIIGWWYHAGLY